MSKNKSDVGDADRDVLDWVVVLYHEGYVTHIEHLTHETAQTYLTMVRDGKGIRLLDQRKAYRPGFIDVAEIMPQVDWDKLGTF
jgi:hypothetical protein